ncbi:sulfotransferase 1C4-like [Drosophila innubila]|uniref:sulfotransferase 1C4-like n=1 Tax=Drosophila innubila TaxID=198719 RepID=UPI00148C89E6|nr:sulfotransferase 1C4-like [Drosophila innubila]
MDKLQVKFPYDIRDVDAETNAELLEYFKGESTGFVQVGPEGYFFPHKYKAQAKHYYNFKARPDDIWISTVPRSGTTWTQEMIWLLANGLDYDQAQQRPLTDRFPFFEGSLVIDDAFKAELLAENKDAGCVEHISRPRNEALDSLPSTQRRFIKTHFPFSLMPPSVFENKCKIIYVERNPKDVAVSYYHLNRLFRNFGYIGDFERYWRYFQNGLNSWLPYYSHVKEAKGHRKLPNVLFLKYEDMLIDLRGTVKRIGDFLGCMPNEDEIEKLLNHLSIKNFRQNKSVNMNQMSAVGLLNEGEASFVRRGGDPNQSDQQEFLDNPNLLKMANDWIQQNL